MPHTAVQNLSSNSLAKAQSFRRITPQNLHRKINRNTLKKEELCKKRNFHVDEKINTRYTANAIMEQAGVIH
jgi:hypothetical protein